MRRAAEATAELVLRFGNRLDPNAGAGLVQASDARAAYLSRTARR